MTAVSSLAPLGVGLYWFRMSVSVTVYVSSASQYHIGQRDLEQATCMQNISNKHKHTCSYHLADCYMHDHTHHILDSNRNNDFLACKKDSFPHKMSS